MRAERVGRGGAEVCAALTEGLDGALTALAVSGLPAEGVALVATGGYGRRELSPFSDVDLMVLHRLDDATEAAAAIFRPLWDGGLKVGHAVRSVREAGKAARERFDTFTTLLSGRLVWGEGDLFERLAEEMVAVTRARPLRRHLVAAESERRRAYPYLMMAADVKSGRGGMRTLHGFDWERRREELIGRFSPPPAEAEDAARESLLRIRNALHAVSGRRHDIYSHELREAVARWLGSDIHRVSRELVEATTTVDRLATRRWPEVVVAESRGRRVWTRLVGVESAPVDDEPRTPGEFAAVLRLGERGRWMLDRMVESGRLQTLLPEWEVVATAPQLAPFHEHPVAAHLWRTVDEMEALVEGGEGDYSAIAAEVDSPDLLTLAAFLHDVGKGRGGDHAEVGAVIARRFCERLGCPADMTATIELAVRHHLLLGDAATRRDLDDPAVIEAVVAEVGDLRRLQVLYLLTVADSRATGTNMWNRWKATLVRTLFVRCAARLGGRLAAGAGTSRRQVVAEAGERGGEVAAFLDALPEEYLRSTPAGEVLWHFGMVHGLTGEADLSVRPGEVADTVAVVGHQTALRRLVAEVFAANGVDVLEARLATRADGIVVDTYRVRDDRTGASVPAERWDRVRSDLAAALAGRLDTEAKVAARARAYAAVAAASSPPRVVVAPGDDTTPGTVTVRCADRIGRLAEVLTVLHELGLEIRLAKLDNRAGQVVDTFHVRGPISGGSEEDADRLARLIEAALSP